MKKVLITGAAGGMGRACARLFGLTYELILTDVAAPGLENFAEELRYDGFTVTSHAGDLASDAILATLAGELGDGEPFALVHTAGLSPSLGSWQAIMEINLIGTERLLRALEPQLVPGTVAVLIASTAAHMMPVLPDVEKALADPLAAGFIEKVGKIMEGMGGHNSPGGMGGISYTLSKRAVVNLCEARANSWGAKGARIVTISPGMILTPMGRSEIANTSGAAQLRDATPAGRLGTAMDIALAAHFLASDNASFISGSDLKVDGGGIAAMKPRPE